MKSAIFDYLDANRGDFRTLIDFAVMVGFVDGHLVKSEIDAIKNTFEPLKQVNKDLFIFFEQQLRESCVEALMEEPDMAVLSKKIKSIENVDVLQFGMNLVMSVVAGDGVVDPLEKELIGDLAEWTGAGSRSDALEKMAKKMVMPDTVVEELDWPTQSAKAQEVEAAAPLEDEQMDMAMLEDDEDLSSMDILSFGQEQSDSAEEPSKEGAHWVGQRRVKKTRR